MAARFGCAAVGASPVASDVRSGGDAGKPIVVDRPDHPVSHLFVDIARRVLEAIESGRSARRAANHCGVAATAAVLPRGCGQARRCGGAVPVRGFDFRFPVC